MKRSKQLLTMVLCILMIATNFGMGSMSRAEDILGQTGLEDTQVAEEPAEAPQDAEESAGEEAPPVGPAEEGPTPVDPGDAENLAEEAAPGDAEPAEEAETTDPAEEADSESNTDTEKPSFTDGTLLAESADYNISLSYGADAMIPDGATLSVFEIEPNSEAYRSYMETTASKIFENKDTEAYTLPYARFFDITILNADGEAVEPASPVQVVIDLKDQVLATEDVEFAAVHFVEEETKKAGETEIVETELVDIETGYVDASDEESTISFDANSFSTYGVIYYYTVDFYYGDAEYHMNGGSEMLMSDLFTKLGIEKSVSDITNVEFTDESLVKFTKEDADWRIKSLAPFSTSETLTIMFSDGEVVELRVKDDKNRTPEGNINWNLSNDGTLTIRPSNSAGFAYFNAVRLSQDAWNGFWEFPRNSGTYIRAEVTKVVIKPNSSGVPISLDETQSHLSYMFSGFTNLESVVIEEGAFEYSTKNLGYMFYNCTSLENVTGLENIDTTYTEQFQRMFSNCTSLEEVNLSSWKNEGYAHNMQNMFNGCTALETVKMPGGEFAVKENALLAGMFENCESLTTVAFGTADDHVDVTKAKTMTNMFKGCSALEELDVSTFGTLTNIVNMDGFVNGCTSLTTLNIDNLDNSHIGPTNTVHSSSDTDSAITGATDFGRMLDLHTCTALETLSAKDSKVWMVHNNRGLPGNEYYNAAFANDIYYFTDKKMTYESDAGPEEKIDSDRDYIDLITDRDGTTNKHTVDPDPGDLPDKDQNINMKDGDLNTNGPGFLAPGVYTLGSETRIDKGTVEMEDTYYRIAYVGSKPYKVDMPDSLKTQLVLIHDDAHQTTRINTVVMPDSWWGNTGNKVIDCGEGIKITYENVAIDCNGKLHDVTVTIKKITFKDLDKIPHLDDELAGVPYTDREHDQNYSAGKVLGVGDWYYRPILQATQADGINLYNYIYMGEPTRPLDESNRMLTGGSGTDVEFTITIDGAADDTSFVFLGKDLDVAYSQDWVYNPNGDACYDNLPVENLTYGQGGEGFVLGDGVKKDTVQFAEHTGLYKSGDMVLSTGSDPNTSWSSFSVTGDATGANFTWTSGIACTSYILENTVEQDLGSITIQPKVFKELNILGLKADQFEFELTEVSTDPDGAPAPTNLPQTKKNDAEGGITFDELIFKTDSTNSAIYGSDTTYYYPGTKPDGNTHGEGEHNKITYTYKVKEIIPSTPDPEISKYDDSEHEIKIVTSTPENDTEMKRGIKAEIYVDGTLVDTYWHSVKYTYHNGSAMVTDVDKWYDKDGNPISNPNPIPLNALKFKNLSVEPIKVTIPVQKILEGRPWKDTDEFAAVMTIIGDHNEPMPEGYKVKDGKRYAEIVINNQGEPVEEGGEVVGYKADFADITYRFGDLVNRETGEPVTEKTFKYHVRELEPSETELVPTIPGVTYDEHPDTVEVTVKYDDTDPDNPKLTYTLKYLDNEGNEITIPSLDNVYDAKQTTYKMEAVKDYRDVTEQDKAPEAIDLKGGEFSFVLKPIGKYAEIAPMPRNTQGEGAARTYTTTNEDDGAIQFEEVGYQDGLVFNYQALLDSGISDDDLHSDEGVDFEYEMYEVIPDGAVNNDNGTWSLVDDEGFEIIYDGTHHTRKITVKVRTNDNATPSDSSDDFDELYIFKENADDLGAPIFLNYRFKQSYGTINVKKIWDDADDQDKIRPSDITISVKADAETVNVDDVVIKGSTWEGAVENLPVYVFNAETLGLDKITYALEEKAVAGYETTYDPDLGEFQFEATEEYRVQLTITNSHTPGEGAAEGDETWGLKGDPQTGTPKYDVNPKNPVTPTSLVKPDAPGSSISDDGKTVTIPGVGKYVLNDDGTVTFTPEPDFIGDPTPIDITCVDKQGKTVTATYTPHVIDPTDTADVSRTINFTYETKDGKKVTDSLTQKGTITRKAAKIDPKTGDVIEWGPWLPYTFPAVKNPDEEAGPEWSTQDVAEALTVTGPGAVDDVYIVYHKKAEPTPPAPTPTGDSNDMGLWIMLLVLTTLLAGVIAARMRINRSK